MRKLLIAASTVIGCALGFAGSIDLNRNLSPRGVTEAIELTISKAYAAKRHARGSNRRGARRTMHRRRAMRRNNLPSFCRWRAPYHYCGGVYYQPIRESGVKVYIVVYP